MFIDGVTQRRHRGARRGSVMDTVGQMPLTEFRKMIETIVEAAIEQKLIEILGDPDEGLEIRASVRDRLLRQQQAVAAGERGQLLADVLEQLGPE
jgi:hypothetical protein